MELLGYADPLSVAPGEQVRFMVSAERAEYEVQIVRLLHADPAPDGPGYQEESVDTLVTGRYPGREQRLHAGSYVLIPDHPRLHITGDLTLQAWIYPTTPQQPRAQGIVTRWATDDGPGFGLFMSPEGDLAFRAGNAHGACERIRSGRPLRARTWYFIACAFDAASGVVCLYQQPLTPWPHDDTAVTVERATDLRDLGAGSLPLLFAASSLAAVSPDRVAPTGLYNGKIDSPRLFNRALDARQLNALRDGASPHEVAGESLVAAWDFALGMDSPRVADTSGHDLHGTAINMPARAMTGRNWTGREIDPRRAPDQYGAIHFHDDDLADAGWLADFTLTVPDGVKSGVYAARLRAGEAEEYIPFFVRPPRGQAAAPIAFLAPTMTYLAYANKRVAIGPEATLRTDSPLAPAPEDRYLSTHPDLGLSPYDLHSDGSGVCYSTWLRPILTNRPKYPGWLTHKPRNFAGDLYLIHWLEAERYPYELITDHDLHHEGTGLLAPYRVVVTGTHPEYWTTPMLDALERYLAAGGRLMYLGGNGFYWVTSVAPHQPQVIEVRRGHAGTRAWTSAPGEALHSTTGEYGGLWRFRGKAPQQVTGVGFTAQGWGGATGYRRQPGSFDPRVSFIFEGIGPDETIGDFGQVLGGASGDEIDRMSYDLGTPPHTLLLASSTGHTDYYQFVVEDTPEMFPGQGGSENPLVRSDMTYFETPSGGAVFSVGSITWCGSLSHDNYQNNVARITGNVLRHFMR